MKRKLLFILCLLALFPACETQHERAQRQEREKIEHAKTVAYMHELLYRKEAFLLSLKYDLPEHEIFKFIIEFNDMEPRITKAIKDGNLERVAFGTISREEINEYAKRLNTSPQIIASILIDLETMRARRE